MNEKVIWDVLMSDIHNPYGVAAVMGNLMAESSMNPLSATGLKKTGYSTVKQYVADSDSGEHDFIHDGVAFGLAQWCFWSRKQGLLSTAQMARKSVSDISVQLVYMLEEMKKYKVVWDAVLNAKDIRTASDVVMLKYERPAGTGEAARAKRAAYGQKYYDQFNGDDMKPEKQDQPEGKETMGKKRVRAIKNVNVRAGAGLKEKKIGLLPKGNSLEWLETKDGWHKVAVWVSGDYSEVVE